MEMSLLKMVVQELWSFVLPFWSYICLQYWNGHTHKHTATWATTLCWHSRLTLQHINNRNNLRDLCIVRQAVLLVVVCKYFQSWKSSLKSIMQPVFVRPISFFCAHIFIIASAHIGWCHCLPLQTTRAIMNCKQRPLTHTDNWTQECISSPQLWTLEGCKWREHGNHDMQLINFFKENIE